MKTLLILILTAANALAAGWQSTEWNKGVNLQAQPQDGFAFVMPAPGGHVNLIAHKWKQIPKGATLTFTYKIDAVSGTPKFKSLDPAPAPPSLKPNFRPMLFNGDWYGSSSRFWPAGAQCAWLVADGQVHTYTIKADPKLWTNVWGKYDAGGFKSLLSHIYQIHLAFGGGNSFSHGVAVTNGTAKFQLINWKVQ